MTDERGMKRMSGAVDKAEHSRSDQVSIESTACGAWLKAGKYLECP